MNIFSSWGQQLAFSFKLVGAGFIAIVPELFIAIVLFVAGWIIAVYVGKAVETVINALKIDSALKSAGVDEVAKKAGITLNTGAFIGWIVKWFIILVFLVESLNFLQLSEVSAFLTVDVMGYLIRVLEAALVLIIATIVGNMLGRFVTASAKAGDIRTANFLGALSRYAILAFAFIIALSELGIAALYMEVLFIGLVSMLALAGGLAFGLGGKEAASRVLERLHDRVKPM